MEEDIMILESECYYLEELGYLRENNHFIRFNQALENLIKGYKELEEELKREKIWRMRLEKENEDTCNEVNNNYIRKSLVVPKYEIEKLKKENEINIDKMRPYRHQGPFDFGVLNGIDECCRKLLEDK